MDGNERTSKCVDNGQRRGELKLVCSGQQPHKEEALNDEKSEEGIYQKAEYGRVNSSRPLGVIP
jgi:hypothetical protein